MTGSCNYTRRAGGTAKDREVGTRKSTMREGWKNCSKGELEKVSVGGLFLTFIPLCVSLALVGVHHVTMCNWPAVTPEFCKQISRETCQPAGLRR